jgi:hypothetical protein
MLYCITGRQLGANWAHVSAYKTIIHFFYLAFALVVQARQEDIPTLLYGA